MKEVQLASRPKGNMTFDNFKVVEVDRPEIHEGEALIRVLYLSIDPYLRHLLNEKCHLMNPFELNKPIEGDILGRVEESRNNKLQKDELIVSRGKWSEYFVLREEDSFVKADTNVQPIAANLGLLGLVGLTAYFGLLDIGKPKEGETLLVSAAAGAVGSIVGQIGKIKGCKVIGIVGSDEKASWITDIGFDNTINYKTEDVDKKLSEYCPNGIDIYFDNVGGKILDTALLHLRDHARIVSCGYISNYDAPGTEEGIKNFSCILWYRAMVQGFIVLDYKDRYEEARQQLKEWFLGGKLTHRHTIFEGLQNAPEAIPALLSGQNIGKLLLKVAPDIPKA